MQCEPRWGGGLSASDTTRDERLSPHPVSHFATLKASRPAPQGAGEGAAHYAAAIFRSSGNGPSTRSTSAESQYSLISLILPSSMRQTMQYWLS